MKKKVLLFSKKNGKKISDGVVGLKKLFKQSITQFQVNFDFGKKKKKKNERKKMFDVFIGFLTCKRRKMYFII